jgi:hypothetical protein
MLDRAMRYIEQWPGKSVYSLTELRTAAGVSLRSQYRLSQQLLASGMVERNGGGYMLAPHLKAAAVERQPVKTTTYNGWSNRETWVVNLWLTNDEHTYNMVRGMSADEIEALVDDCYLTGDLHPGFMSDLINSALAHVDWREIAESVNAE